MYVLLLPAGAPAADARGFAVQFTGCCVSSSRRPPENASFAPRGEDGYDGSPDVLDRFVGSMAALPAAVTVEV